MKLLEILKTPECWTKGAYVKDEMGNSCSLLSAGHSFCLVGALAVTQDLEMYNNWIPLRQGFMYAGLVSAVKRLGFGDRLNESGDLSTFNDHPDTTFEDVRKVILEAGL